MTDTDFSLTRAQVQAAQAGDDAALNDLFQRYLPRVTRLVAARLGKQWAELANEEDLVQESFVDALKALRAGKLATDGDFCNWMATCVQNNIRDQFRRAHAGKRDRKRVRRQADMSESFLTDTILGADAATPSQFALARETEAHLEAALRGLSPVYREVISLRAYCGMSYRQVAETMGLPSENTANVLFLRARAELRKRL
ncbi:MAG: RNA polymerase sigma factor [Planctomycetota bacterium]